MTDDLAPGSGASSSGPAAAAALGGADRSLLGLVDRLAVLLERSELTELEVEAGGTGLVLRKASALHPAGGAEPIGAAQAVAVGPGPAGAPPCASNTRRDRRAALRGALWPCARGAQAQRL